MSQFSLGAYLTSLTTFSVAIFVFFCNRKSITNKIFSLYSLSISEWSFFTASHAIVRSQALSIFLAKMMNIGVPLIPVLFFHFCLVLLDSYEKYKNKLFIGYFICAVLIIANFTTSLLITNVQPKLGYHYFMNAGIMYPLLVAYFAIYVIFSLYLLSKAYGASFGNRRNQLKYLLGGSVIGYAFGVSNFLPVYDVTIFPYPFGSYAISFYVGIAAYAIIRHHLMDIEVIVKKTLVFAALFTIVFGIFVGTALLIQQFVGVGGHFLGFAISSFIIILTVRPLEILLVRVTDKYLFQKKYDYKELLKTFTSEVLTVLDIEDLLNLTVDKLTAIIKLNSCAVLIFNNETQRFDVMASRHIKDSSVTLVKPDSIVSFLEHTHGCLSRNDLAGKKISIPDDIQVIMNNLSSELLIPMILHEKMIGILSLGKKKSDEEYSQDDLDILLPLARTLAIAISNAELFKELGRAQAEAAQKEKMAVIGTLSAGINHEICNPLGIARGQCEAFLLNIKDGLYKDKPTDELLHKAQQIMMKVIRETDRATAITKKLSSFAKPAKGEAELIDVNRELEEVFGLVSYELKLDKIEIEKNVADNLPSVFVDRKQFQEVLFNLLRNAGQAMGEKGKITVSAREVDDRVVIDIQDTGTGVAPDKIKELFNPFFTTKEPGKGTGLGLFIVRQVTEKNGGKIYMKSTKVGEGTTFTVEFPVSDANKVKV